MCLEFINATYEPVLKCEPFAAYKVFEVIGGGFYSPFLVVHRNNQRYLLGKEYDADDANIKVIPLFSQCEHLTYKTGFHSFEEYCDAEKFYYSTNTNGHNILVQVLITDITAYGLDTSNNLGVQSEKTEFYKCFVSKKMKITKILLDSRTEK